MIEFSRHIAEKLAFNAKVEHKPKMMVETIQQLRKEMMARAKGNQVIDVSDIDVSGLTDFSRAFSSLEKVEIIYGLDNWNTTKATNMDNMFFYCTSLKEIDLSGFDTSNVTSMNGLFSFCHDLEDIELGFFDTSHVKNMSNMFNNCKSIKEVDMTSFDTSSVEMMNSMFKNCKSLERVDMRGLDVSNVRECFGMFFQCDSLKKVDGFDDLKLNIKTRKSSLFSKDTKEIDLK